MDVNVDLKGWTELKTAIEERASTEMARKLVIHHGNALEKKMKQEAVFVRGYSTGATREGIHTTYSYDGMTATVGPRTSYSPYVEWGTRYMSAQPFVGPAFNYQKALFLNDLDKLVR